MCTARSVKSKSTASFGRCQEQPVRRQVLSIEYDPEDLIGPEKSGEKAFEGILGEAAKKYGGRMHASVAMKGSISMSTAWLAQQFQMEKAASASSHGGFQSTMQEQRPSTDYSQESRAVVINNLFLSYLHATTANE